MDSHPPTRPNAIDSSQDADAGFGPRDVYQHLVYGLSLPERSLRSASALLAGAVQESAELLLPQAFRSSRSYSLFVQQMLDFMAQDVGGVDRPADDNTPPQLENYVARKTVGSFIDLAGMATLHLSPAAVLAIVSDVAYGSQTYLQELSKELKRTGVIDPDSTIDHASDLLDAIQRASAQTSAMFDTPPLSVDGLQETIQQTREAMAELDPTRVMPRAEIERLWNEMVQVASQQHVSVFAVSSTMSMFALGKLGAVSQGALSTVKVAGNMFDRHILDHYEQALTAIRSDGVYATMARESRPYREAVWRNFTTGRTTLTEELLSGKLLTRGWRWLRSLGAHAKDDHATGSSEANP